MKNPLVPIAQEKKGSTRSNLTFDMILQNKKLEIFLEKINKDDALLNIGDEVMEKIIETFSYRNMKKSR